MKKQEAVIQSIHDLLGSQDRCLRCRQFDGERNSVQPPAQVRNCGGNRLIEVERMIGNLRAVNEEGNGLVLADASPIFDRGRHLKAHELKAILTLGFEADLARG